MSTNSRIWNPFELRRVLTHELVHAFDFARAEIDPANAQHVACTEVQTNTIGFIGVSAVVIRLMFNEGIAQKEDRPGIS